MLLACIVMLAMVATLSTGCAGDYIDNSKRNTVSIDNDHDGYVVTNDCDDNNAARHQWRTALQDGDTDGRPECGMMTISVCSGNTTQAPYGFTFNTEPCDLCPGNHANNCGTTAPSIQITAVVNGHTVTITADPRYTSGYTTQVVFYSGVVQIGTDSSANGGWNFTWTNVAAGTYTVCAVMWTNDGKHATSNTVTVTVGNAQCEPMLRLNYQLRHDDQSLPRDFFNMISTSCFVSFFGQDPNWQWTPPQTCGSAANSCVIEDEVWSGPLNKGKCEFNIAAGAGLNGNPAPSSFQTDGGYGVDWALTPIRQGTTIVDVNDFIPPGTLHAQINTDCAHWVDVPTVYDGHTWGVNYMLDIAGVGSGGTPQDGNTVNIYVHSYADSDSDLIRDNVDNCIMFSNNDQLDTNQDGVGNVCTASSNACSRDADNDGYYDCVDLFPYDRIRH